jgi:hypothetical protein
MTEMVDYTQFIKNDKKDDDILVGLNRYKSYGEFDQSLNRDVNLISGIESM